MQDVIDRIAAQVGIAPELAEKATSMFIDFISKHAPAQYVDQIKPFVPGFDEAAAIGAAHTQAAAEAAPAGGGLMGALGGLMGGGGIAGALGSLMGGEQSGMGAAMALVGHLQQDGLDLGQVQSVATGLVAHLREVAGNDVVDKLLAELPGVGKFLA